MFDKHKTGCKNEHIGDSVKGNFIRLMALLDAAVAGASLHSRFFTRTHLVRRLILRKINHLKSSRQRSFIPASASSCMQI